MANNRLGSVANAARVLKSFRSDRPTWGVTELAAHLDLSTSTTHRLLSTLADEGMLERDVETGRYRPGLSIFDLAAAAPPRQRSLHEASLVAMTELRARTGETVQIGVLDGREVVYVDRLDSPNTLSLFRGIGRRMHAHSTSTGKVVLAFTPKRQRELLLDDWQLAAVTENTITDPNDFRRELIEIRRVGYAENRHESEIGVVSVAAPIRDSSGNAIAGLSLVGPAERLDPHWRVYTDAVVTLARVISRHMGWSAQ